MASTSPQIYKALNELLHSLKMEVAFNNFLRMCLSTYEEEEITVQCTGAANELKKGLET
jgi:hypothetical protein